MKVFLPFWFALLTPLLASAQTNVYVQTGFQTADDLYIAGRYEEALAEYRLLYEQSGDPEFLFKMGRSAHQLGQNQAAIDCYRGFLLSSHDAQRRTDAESYLNQLAQPKRDPNGLSPDPFSLEQTPSPQRTNSFLYGQSKSNKLFRISAATGVAALATGVGAAIAATNAQNNFVPGDDDVDLTKFAALVALTDVLAVTSISTGIAGAVVRKREKRAYQTPTLSAPKALTVSAANPPINHERSKKLLLVSSATGAIGMGFGLASVLQSTQTINDGVNTLGEFQRLRAFALASDLFFTTAVATGIAGLVVRKREKRATQEPTDRPQFSLAPSSNTRTKKLGMATLGLASAAACFGVSSLVTYQNATQDGVLSADEANVGKSVALTADVLVVSTIATGISYIVSKLRQ